MMTIKIHRSKKALALLNDFLIPQYAGRTVKVSSKLTRRGYYYDGKFSIPKGAAHVIRKNK